MYSVVCLKIILIYTIWTIVTATNFSVIDNEENTNRLIVSHLTYMVLNSIKDQRNILIQTKGCTQKSEQMLQYLANNLIYNNVDNTIILDNIDQFDMNFLIHIHLLFVDSFNSFSDLFDKHKNIVTHEVYYLIVLHSGNNTEQHSTCMTRMFERLFVKLIVNANILTFSAEVGMEMFTYFPYSIGDCQSQKPVKIFGSKDVHFFSKKRMEFIKFFPSKLSNFNECPLKISIAPIKPYITLHPNETGLKRISGIEGKIVELIATKLNFSYEYHIYDSQHIGYVYPNLSTTGVFKELAEGRADFALGGTSCTHFRMRLLPCSKQYFMSKVRVMLKPGEHYTALEVLFYPFKIEAWLLLFSLVNIRILLKLLSKHLEVHQGFVQLLLIAWLLMIFFYRISFEGSYFKFLHNQPLKPLPSSAEEMKKQKYGVVSDLCHIRFKEYYIDLKIGVIKDFTLWQTIAFIRDTNEKIAALVNIEILTYYLSKNTEERGNFLVIKDGMMLDPLCIYFKRSSFLVHAFNKIIMELDIHGITKKIVNEYVNYNYIPSTTYETVSLNQRDVFSLGLHHLSAAFYLLMIFLLIATIIFAFECLSYKFVFFKNLFDYLSN